MMSESTSQTPPTEPVETEPQGAATPPDTAPGAATDDDEVVQIKKSDLKKLQSQRDGNHERARQTEYQVALMLQKEDISKFLSDPENKKKFPDVETDDLLDAESEEDFEKLAGQTQARVDKAAQRRLGDLQTSQTPSMTPQEKAARLKQLKEKPGSASFQEMLSLQGQ
jgi:hypothetical protein